MRIGNEKQPKNTYFFAVCRKKSGGAECFTPCTGDATSPDKKQRGNESYMRFLAKVCNISLINFNPFSTRHKLFDGWKKGSATAGRITEGRIAEGRITEGQTLRVELPKIEITEG